MGLWESYPGKWLARKLEDGAVLARTQVRSDKGAAGTDPVSALEFPERLLAETFPRASSWWKSGGHRSLRLVIESHDEEHEMRLRALPGRDPLIRAVRIARTPPAESVLADSNRIGALAVLTLDPRAVDGVLRGRVWIARNETEEADIEEAFDQDGFGSQSDRNTILRWAR